MSISKAIVDRTEKLAKVAELACNAPDGSFEEVILMMELKKQYADLIESVKGGFENADLYTDKAIDNYNYLNKSHYEEKDFDLDNLFDNNPFTSGFLGGF